MDKKNIVEIKKGQTGTGLLIEHDGYISINEGENKKLFESFNNADSSNEFNVPYPFVVSAVFQKYGIENQNGRIYPEHILKREVAKYQQKINEKRAYGECYTPDAMVLTENGWKLITDTVEGENILTLNTETNEIEIKPILRKIELDYDGEMIRLFNEALNEITTINHKFPVYSVEDNTLFGMFTSMDIFEKNIKDLDKKYIPYMNINNELNNSLILSNINTELITYKGKVVCLEVENHTFYVNTENSEGLYYGHWTCNCNHPADSTIDLGRLAMNIIELHWEGQTLVGKLELPVSHGFRKYGIISCLADTVAHWILSGLKVGVSSRGLGSVEQRMGKMIVGDDFELVCWDVVSDPSTPGAWIDKESENLKQYVESKTPDKNGKTAINENNLKKIEKWLNII